MNTRYRWQLVPALTLAATACTAHPRPAAAPAEHWLATWAPSQQLVEQRNMPPAPLAHATLRQVFRVTVGGPRIRVHLSNLFGDGPVAIGAARLARSAGGSAIETASERALTFRGADSVTIPAGGEVTSDPLDFSVETLAALALSLRIGAAPAALTGHPGSRTTSYLEAGDHVSASELSGAAATEHWYLAAGLDVVAEGAAIAALGNSITDGRGSGTNKDDRWTDDLARRLLADPRTAHVSVVNEGLGGNCILKACLGPPAMERFDRDVLGPAGARWAIVLEGVNDLGGARAPGAAATVARDLIAAYQQMIARAHARGLKIYGATITPFGGSFYGGPERQAARDTVNAWIRSSGAFDAVIDFDQAVRDPSDPQRLQSTLDTGDHLHPNEAGYHAMADAIDLRLFAP